MSYTPPASPRKGIAPRVDDPDIPAAIPSRPPSTMELQQSFDHLTSSSEASSVSAVGSADKDDNLQKDSMQQLKEDLKMQRALQLQKKDVKINKKALKTSTLAAKVVDGVEMSADTKVTVARCQTNEDKLVEDQALPLSDQKQIWRDRRLSVDQHGNQNFDDNDDKDNDNGNKGNFVNDAPGAYPIRGIIGSNRGITDGHNSFREQQVPQGDDNTMEEGQLAIAARVVERTDDEIEDAVRARLLAEAVKAEEVTVISDQDPKKRRRRYCMAFVLGFITVTVISVAFAMSRNGNVDDGHPKIAVALQLDQFPTETGWNLTCTSGKNDSSDVVLNVAVPQGTYNVSFAYVMSEPISVDYGYECQLSMTDEYGDGFCCRHGDGYFQIFLLVSEGEGDVLLLQETGEVGAETIVNFTVPSPGHESNDNSSSIPTDNSTSPPSWAQIGPEVNGQKAGDRLGSAVSVATPANNITIVAIGAPGELSGNSPGYVKVQLYDTLGTRQLGQIIFGDNFDLHTGSSVSLSRDGTLLAVGAPAGTDGIPGSVIVYQYDDASDRWSFKGRKIIGGGSTNDGFGTSASISPDGTTLVVGAPFSGTNGDVDVGRVQVYVFNATSSEWIQLGRDIVGTTKGDQFGFSVSISNDGRTVAVGAPSPGAERSGYSAVYIYGSLSKEWLRIGNIIMGSDIGDESGTSVCLNGNGTRVVVGSPHITEGTAGYVRVLEYNSTHWEQVGRDLVDISGGAAESVSLSADGLTVAIGARTANNVTGRVRVFRQENMTCVYPFCWDQVGENIVGNAPGELFGDAVSLSPDGHVLVVGSPFASDASGTVRVMMNTTN